MYCSICNFLNVICRIVYVYLNTKFLNSGPGDPGVELGCTFDTNCLQHNGLYHVVRPACLSTCGVPLGLSSRQALTVGSVRCLCHRRSAHPCFTGVTWGTFSALIPKVLVCMVL